jgi:hypothetical protein
VGEIEINNVKPADSHWSQKVHLRPGWYQFTAEIRTHDVAKPNAGANLSLLDGGIISRTLNGSNDWRRVGFYLKVGDAGADVSLACRLGGFSSPNTGRAQFRHVSGIREQAPLADDMPRYDLDQARGIKTSSASGQPLNPPESPDAPVPSKPIAVFVRPAARASQVTVVFEKTVDAIEYASAVGVVAAALFVFYTRQQFVKSWLKSRNSKMTCQGASQEKLQVLLVCLGAVCFAAAFSWPILGRLGRIGLADDWSEHLQPNWVAFYTISHFHQVPLWNPYRCGGMPLLAHPLSLCVSPTFLVQLIFGPFVGIDLQIPIHIAIGWIGGYLLATSLGMGFCGRIACASIFPASSWFYLHMAVGHLEYLPAMYMPLTLALFWLGTNRHRVLPCLMAGLLLAITFGEGGVYQCTRVVILALLLSLYLAVVNRSLWPIWAMAALSFSSIGFAAIKLLPCWYDVMRLHSRPIGDLEYNHVRVLLTGIFTRDQFWDRFAAGRPIPGGRWGFFELGAYLSPAAAALVATGIGASPRKVFPWLLVGVLFFALSIGGPASWYPWSLLHHLPLFSAERVPQRCMVGFILAAGVIAAEGADYLSRRMELIGTALASALIVAAVVDAWFVNRPNLDTPAEAEAPRNFGESLAGTRLSGLPSTTSASPHFRQFYGSPWEMVGTAESNMGAVFCNEGMTDFYDITRRSVVGFNQAGYFGEQFLNRPGSVTLRRWTPNILSFDVDTPTSNLLMVNQVYDPNWRIARGSGETVSAEGLIAARLPLGRQHLVLAYRSPAFTVGALITLVTSMIAIVFWRLDT